MLKGRVVDRGRGDRERAAPDQCGPQARGAGLELGQQRGTGCIQGGARGPRHGAGQGRLPAGAGRGRCRRPADPAGQEPEHRGRSRALRIRAGDRPRRRRPRRRLGRGRRLRSDPRRGEDRVPRRLARARERSRRRVPAAVDPDRALPATTRTSRARSARSSPASSGRRTRSTPRRCSPRWLGRRRPSHDPGPRRLRGLHRLRDRRADGLRHHPHLGRAQAGGGDGRPHRRQPRVPAHPVHADQARLVGPVPRHGRRAQDAAEGGLQAQVLRLVRVRRRAVGRVHAGAAGVRGRPVRRHPGPGPAVPVAGRVVRRTQLPDADRPPRRGAADRVRVRRHDDHRRDARRLVVGEQVLAARRAARGLADDLVRADPGPDGAGPDPDLRHARPDRDRPPAVRRPARASCPPGVWSTSRSRRSCSSPPR